MIKIVSASQMQTIDRACIDTIGIPGTVLMENAGLQVVDRIRKMFEGSFPQRVIIICGRGNNGGDGFVVARHLMNKGLDVTTILLGPSETLKGDSRINWNICVKSGVEVLEITEPNENISLFELFMEAHLIVDAILGTGLTTPVKGYYEEVINFINESDVPVISIDIPSGLNSDTGLVIGPAVKADMTVTFGFPKLGTVFYPAADYCGVLEIADIGIPPNVELEADHTAVLLEKTDFNGILGSRDRNAHKGSFGHLLVVGGSPGKTGAAAMCGQSALRLGAGLVTVGIPAGLNPVLEMKLTEVMSLPFPETGSQTLALKALDPILEFCYRVRALALGPGISTDPETVELVRKLLDQCPVPVVLDADGINALAGNCDILLNRKVPTIITPHPGEMARLMDTSASEIQTDRIGAAREFAKRYGVIVVLKGARTVIAEPNGRVYVNPTGNPGMASGGTGDILTGIIAGVLTQGLDPIDAANLGVFLHGLAADLAVDEISETALTAMDILDFIPDSIVDMELEVQ